ncbi:MAG TPA: hypothetical protein VKA26_14405 [Ignavibacteriaceae bacterium]|nr:hypothetical protein [Ignavibacteriaceae bacterium]
MRSGLIKFLLLISFVYTTGFAQTESVSIGNISPGEIQYKAFTLDNDSKIEITGQAATFRDRHDSWFFDDNNRRGWTNNLMFYGWIIDAKSRVVVWHSLEAYPEIRESKNTDFIPMNSTVDLPAGNYEVYFASAKMNYNNYNNDGDFVRWIKDFFGFGENEFKSKYKNELSIKVSGQQNVFHQADMENFRKQYLAHSILNIEEATNKDSYSKGFSLKADTKLRVYAVGEARKRETFDYAWIYDEVNNKIAWRMTWDNTTYAGGAEKNVVFNNEISLPAGTYTVHYVTDDSHAFGRWNSFPPDDPQFWGVAVFPASASDLANVIPFRKEDVVSPVVELTKMGDDQFVSQGLRVKSPTEIRILCLGESTNNQDYVDYGWIINADTREKVWAMDGRAGENAGGAEKNRMIDQTIKLQPGNYIVYYETDDSHSYEGWNSAAPYDPTKWGITIWTPGDKKKSNTELFTASSYKNKNVVAEIIRVRDNEHLEKTFELKADTDIRVYAIGEGSGNRMVDYGWIEDYESGRVVWDMSYRRTESAGGARKNRQINEVIKLPKGKYKLYYETDDSHSYRDWNANPPVDQEDYGITLSYSK